MFQCPDCKDDSNLLTIHAPVMTVIQVAEDESVEDSEQQDLEWADDTAARCSCGWSGTVAAMTIDEEDENDDETPAEPITLTREEAIETLIDYRLEEHDADDLRDWLRDGRIGYAEMSNAELAELYAEMRDMGIGSVTVTGEEPKP